MAHFETYILNYNGIRFLPRCLDSLLSLDLGPHSLGINVVDKASADGSEELIDEHYPQVNYIALDKNYGFSSGNNLGVAVRSKELEEQNLKADFHILLNNDTEVEQNWLLAAYEVFARNPKAGIVGSKAIFDDLFIPISLECENSYCPGDFGIHDSRRLGALLHYGYSGSNIINAPGRIKFKNAHAGQGHGCALGPDATIYLPVKNPLKDAWGALYMENHHPAQTTLSIKMRIGEQAQSRRIEIPCGGVTPVLFNATQDDYCEYIQNAGSFVTDTWYSGDRGFLTPNGEDFNKVEQVASVCGVSMFVRDKTWKELKGFDEAFFAYYEDTDLSLRAQQLGWECYYTPDSILRHVHCGSGVEFSEYFLKNVAWSHLLFCSKTMNRQQWKEKLRSSKQFAQAEFAHFEIDHTLESKPNLQAYMKYLQHYPLFVRNRFRATYFPVEKSVNLLQSDPVQV